MELTLSRVGALVSLTQFERWTVMRVPLGDEHCGSNNSGSQESEFGIQNPE